MEERRKKLDEMDEKTRKKAEELLTYSSEKDAKHQRFRNARRRLLREQLSHRISREWEGVGSRQG